MSDKQATELEIQDAVKLLTDKGFIKWCQSKPLDAGDFKSKDGKN